MSHAKIAIILHSGSDNPEGLGRAAHALLYAKDLHDRGHGVRLIFDGAGTTWIPELGQPDHSLYTLFLTIRDQVGIYAVCDFCAAAHGVKDSLGALAGSLRGEFRGHPSLAALIEEGFQPIVL